MLNPNDDRLDYGEILSPPTGYELDTAIGTTYSLDLDALVGASLSLGLAEETDSLLMNNPVCLLEALRLTGDKITLFCEGGQIHMPNNPTSLYILLEKMVFSVQTEKKSGTASYPSFHPKCWIIRFRNAQNKPLYRFIILSRNLTFDRSWDVSYYMDGTMEQISSAKNEHLRDFLRYLIKQLPSDENGKKKAADIRSMIKELPYVAFNPEEKDFYDYDFITNGIISADGWVYSLEDEPLFQDTFHEIFIMSPFLTGSVIKNFNDRNAGSGIRDARYVLITRQMSLAKLKAEDVTNFELYTLKDAVIDGETGLSDETCSTQKQDIHAKIYMVRKYTNSDLYLGSANASHNAMHGNVELMLCLRAKNRHLNLDKLLDSLFVQDADGLHNPFCEVWIEDNPPCEENEQEKALDTVIKAINRSEPYARVTEDGKAYQVDVFFKHCDTAGCEVTIRPLLSHKEKEFAEKVIFDRLDVVELSEFYVLKAALGNVKIERVIKIPTEGFPESREKSVISNVVSDKDCFYRYIAFLLGDDAVLSMLENNQTNGEPQGYPGRKTYQIPALYEKMLQTAATNPGKFQGIEYLMRAISDDGVIPDDFKKLYDTFKKVVRLDG